MSHVRRRVSCSICARTASSALAPKRQSLLTSRGVHLRSASFSRGLHATSFIARALEANDPRVLLGPFRAAAGGYDACLSHAGMEVTAIGPEGVACSLVVSRALTNNYSTLHGGAIATIVDVVGTLAILGRDPLRPGISVEMNQSFCSAAAEGDRLEIHGSVLRLGKTLAFTEVTIRTGAAAKLVATGRHTKMFTAARARDPRL